jgi:predicted nucleic acid-binding protein
MVDRFADTSGWASWADDTQKFHALALKIVNETWTQGHQLVTTNWVLAELTALLTSPLRMPKRQQIQLLEGIHTDPGVRVVTIDPLLERAGWTLWENRPDKDWSLVDCVSFHVMQELGLTEAMTADHHFEQAGFVRLLK